MGPPRDWNPRARLGTGSLSNGQIPRPGSRTKPSSWPGRKYIHPSARPLPSLAVRLEAVSCVFSRHQGEPSCQSQVLEARPLDHIAHPAVPATPRRRRQIIDAVPSGLRSGRLVVRTAHVTQPHAVIKLPERPPVGRVGFSTDQEQVEPARRGSGNNPLETEGALLVLPANSRFHLQRFQKPAGLVEHGAVVAPM